MKATSADAYEKGGLHVILPEFHESARVERQLFRRSTRQGDPGTVEAIVSLQDELFVRHAPLLTCLVAKSLTQKSNTIKQKVFRFLVLYARTKAERQTRKVRLDTERRDRKWLQALGFIGQDKK